MKGELGGKIMTKFVGLRVKTCSYLIDIDSLKKDHKEFVKSNKLILKTCKDLKV